MTSRAAPEAAQAIKAAELDQSIWVNLKVIGDGG
jgi:hypothetical protein